MDGVLNTTTNTVHKPGNRSEAPESKCGATRYVDDNRLDSVDVQRAVTNRHAAKCGRCFSDGRGY